MDGGTHDGPARHNDRASIRLREGRNILTSLEDLTVEVTEADGSIAYYTGDITVPETVEWNGRTFTVTAIGESAFYYNQDITSVNMPASITSIEHYAFSHCSQIDSIIIPDNVTYIGAQAFYRWMWNRFFLRRPICL